MEHKTTQACIIIYPKAEHVRSNYYGHPITTSKRECNRITGSLPSARVVGIYHFINIYKPTTVFKPQLPQNVGHSFHCRRRSPGTPSPPPETTLVVVLAQSVPKLEHPMGVRHGNKLNTLCHVVHQVAKSSHRSLQNEATLLHDGDVHVRVDVNRLTLPNGGCDTSLTTLVMLLKMLSSSAMKHHIGAIECSESFGDCWIETVSD